MTKPALLAAFSASLMFMLGLTSPALASSKAPSTDDCDTGQYIVRLKPTESKDVSQFSADRVIAKSVDNSVATVILTEDELPLVQSSALSIERDCLIHVSDGPAIEKLPNDPQSQTSPRISLNLAKAWGVRTASDVIVAISDTGTDYTHPDLAANIWTNQIELNGRAHIDDDGNGCIDDIHGCDLGDLDGDPLPFAGDEGSHGTHVAGIIGAVGNNSLGVNGVAWSATMMPVKGFDRGGTAYSSSLIKTIYYAVNNGARVINCSWGADRDPTQAEIDAFKYAISHGALPVVAAGNSAHDAAKTSPASIDGVLAVGSINSLDHVSAFSNYGAKVSVYAPGGDGLGVRDEYILSTFPNATYGNMRGTSMAAPFVSGIAALIFSVNHALTASDVKQIIVASSRRVQSELPDGNTSNILIPDAYAALIMAATYIPSPSPPSQPTKLNTPTSASPANSTPASASSASSSSCAFKRDANFGWAVVLPFMFVLAFRETLKRRDA